MKNDLEDPRSELCPGCGKSLEDVGCMQIETHDDDGIHHWHPDCWFNLHDRVQLGIYQKRLFKHLFLDDEEEQ